VSKIQDLDTGEVIDVNDADLPSLVTAKNVAIPQGEYDFENPLGERVKVPADQFRQAVDAGFKYVDQSIKEDERLQAEYGDSPVRSLAEGALRSLTLGVSDQLLIKAGADQEGLRERKERNPLSAGTGEVLGIIAPIIASGGATGVARGIGAKVLEKTAAGQVAKIAASAGKGAGQLFKNEIAKGAVKLGVEGGIEGALLGVGKTISEDALGDTEFSAESLAANVGTGALSGVAFGSALGATGAVVSKLGRGAITKLKDKAINELNIPEAEKAILRAQKSAEESLEKIGQSFENPELKQAITELGFKTEPTVGVLSPSIVTKRLEASLAESPSLAGLATGGNLKKFSDELQEKASQLLDKAKDTTPYELGTRARQQIMGGINERLRPAQETLKRVYDDLGQAPVSEQALKLLRTRIKKSDVASLGLDKGLAAKIESVLPELNSINRVNTYKKLIGKEMSMAYRTGDLNQADLLSDIYDTLSRVERKGIEDAALRAGPKRGPKLAQAYTKAFDESMEAYRSIYKEYTPLAEQLGTKLRRPDDFLDWLESAEAEKIGGKLIDLNDYSAALKLNKEFPELYDIARGRKLADFAQKVQGKNGEISFRKFQTAVQKMSPEQKKIMFGFEASQQKRLNQLIKVMSEIPEQINPSDPSINQTFLDMINPLFQGKELLRYAVYRGGDKAIRNYLLKTVPVLTETEKSINKTKSSISRAVNGFYRSSAPTIAVGALALNEDRKIENAKKVYEQVQNDPQAFIDRFMVKNKDLIEAAPNVSMALQQNMVGAMRFLQSKVPSKKTDYLAHEYTPSRSELLGFQEYVEAVEKPLAVFDKMAQGYISPRHIEALKVVYPKLYGALQSDLSARLPKKLTKTQKTMLQQILGVKVSPIADYNLLKSVTGPTVSGAPTQPQGKVPVSGAKMLNQSARNMAGTFDMTMNRP
jgi:hypothetical protein